MKPAAKRRGYNRVAAAMRQVYQVEPGAPSPPASRATRPLRGLRGQKIKFVSVLVSKHLAATDEANRALVAYLDTGPLRGQVESGVPSPRPATRVAGGRVAGCDRCAKLRQVRQGPRRGPSRVRCDRCARCVKVRQVESGAPRVAGCATESAITPEKNNFSL